MISPSYKASKISAIGKDRPGYNNALEFVDAKNNVNLRTRIPKLKLFTFTMYCCEIPERLYYVPQ